MNKDITYCTSPSKNEATCNNCKRNIELKDVAFMTLLDDMYLPAKKFIDGHYVLVCKHRLTTAK